MPISGDEEREHLALLPEDNELDNLYFENLGLKQEVLSAIRDQGYQKPTLIQAKSIPLILKGLDLLAAAQTGTGKTASFSLPIIDKLLNFANKSTSPALHPVRALILTPTRELADQVHHNIASYAKYTELRCAVIYGGVDIRSQSKILQKGVEILTATPGRLIDHLDQKNTYLSQVQVLVLDEADRMLDMGFMPDLRKIIALLPAHRQTLLFSATFSREIRALASRYMSAYQVLEVAQPNTVTALVEQFFFDIGSGSKEEALCYLLENRNVEQAIIFCNSKQNTEKLTYLLQSKKFSVAAIHGDKNQAERTQILETFKNGHIPLLIATDVVARGLDIVDLPVVINFDLPFSAEDYIHRIGRTGRAGLSGKAFSILQSKEYPRLRDIASLIQKDISTIKLYPVFEKREKFDVMSRNDMAFNARKNRQFHLEKKIDPIFFEPYTPSSHNEDKDSSLKASVPVKGNANLDKRCIFLKKSSKTIKKDGSRRALLLGGIKK